jgi:hypothetical protein
VIDRTALNPDGVRGLLGLSGFSPVIGTFGFLLPGKGLTELIHSFALILKAYPTAYLLMVNADYPLPESHEERERCRALVRLLEIEDRVRMTSEFLEVEETLFLLSACDVIVYPYQRSDESASGAVRLGLAAGRPVVTTPLPTFSDISDVVHQLGGTGPTEIAEGIISLLRDEESTADLLQRQRDWVRANGWAIQAARISNIVLGCFEETRSVELRTTIEAGSGLSLPPDATVRKPASSSSLPDEDLPKLSIRQRHRLRQPGGSVFSGGSARKCRGSIADPTRKSRCRGRTEHEIHEIGVRPPGITERRSISSRTIPRYGSNTATR